MTDRDEHGNLTDGCGTEHDPASNLGCDHAPAPPVVLAAVDPEVVTTAPDMTHVIVADMVEGVKRYESIAADAVKQADQYRTYAAEQDATHVEYVGKAKALADLLTRLGYDPATGDRIPVTVVEDLTP